MTLFCFKGKMAYGASQPKAFERFDFFFCRMVLLQQRNKLLKKKFAFMAQPCNIVTYVRHVEIGRSWQILNGHYLQSDNKA